MRKSDNVVRLRSGPIEVETRLMTIVSSLAFLRGMAGIVDARQTEVTGEELWGMLSLIENEAKAALEAHTAR